MRILGKQTALVLCDQQVTEKLVSRQLFSGISEVAYVEDVVRNSIAGCDILEFILDQKERHSAMAQRR